MAQETHSETEWLTKPTDRFILKWIKVHLSATVTRRLAPVGRLRPWMITLWSMILGIVGGGLFALGWGLLGGLFGACSQVLDGVDGQLARLTGRQSSPGAFLDSVLDRYTDTALVMGLLLFVLRSGIVSQALLAGLAFLALAGSGLISYTSARADTLGISLGAATLASKGTRATVIVLSGLLSPLSVWIPFGAVVYLVVHTNAVVALRIARAYRFTSQKQGS